MTEYGFITEFDSGHLKTSSDGYQGFRPYQLMATSIACCSGSGLRTILRKQRMEINGIEILAEITRSDEVPKRIEKIHLHFVISGKGLDPKKIQKAVDLGYKYCSMAQSVKNSIAITESFEISDS